MTLRLASFMFMLLFYVLFLGSNVHVITAGQKTYFEQTHAQKTREGLQKKKKKRKEAKRGRRRGNVLFYAPEKALRRRQVRNTNVKEASHIQHIFFMHSFFFVLYCDIACASFYIFGPFFFFSSFFYAVRDGLMCVFASVFRVCGTRLCARMVDVFARVCT